MEQWLDVDFKNFFYTRNEHKIPIALKQEQIAMYDALKCENVDMWKVTLKKPAAKKKIVKKKSAKKK